LEGLNVGTFDLSNLPTFKLRIDGGELQGCAAICAVIASAEAKR
jgi:hypothetical protein